MCNMAMYSFFLLLLWFSVWAIHMEVIMHWGMCIFQKKKLRNQTFLPNFLVCSSTLIPSPQHLCPLAPAHTGSLHFLTVQCRTRSAQRLWVWPILNTVPETVWLNPEFMTGPFISCSGFFRFVFLWLEQAFRFEFWETKKGRVHMLCLSAAFISTLNSFINSGLNWCIFWEVEPTRFVRKYCRQINSKIITAGTGVIDQTGLIRLSVEAGLSRLEKVTLCDI